MKTAFVWFAWATLCTIATSLVLFAALVPEKRKEVSWASADEEQIEQLVAAHKGKVIVVDFWASWCAPCRSALPDTIKWSKKYPELVVLTVSFDRVPEAGHNFLKKLDATETTNLFFTGKKAPFGFPGYIPYLVLFDKAGVQHDFSESKMLELLGEK